MRRSIEVPGLSHGGMPIPAASLVGNLLVSGGVSGADPVSGELPGEIEAQVAGLFANVERLMKAAGGSPEDVVKMTFFVRDRACREVINSHWVGMFPDEDSRPARHTLVHELPGSMLIQCEVMAVVGEGIV